MLSWIIVKASGYLSGSISKYISIWLKDHMGPQQEVDLSFSSVGGRYLLCDHGNSDAVKYPLKYSTHENATRPLSPCMLLSWWIQKTFHKNAVEKSTKSPEILMFVSKKMPNNDVTTQCLIVLIVLAYEKRCGDISTLNCTHSFGQSMPEQWA